MDFPDLEDKIIGLVLAHQQLGMIVLERAKIETVSGRVFITGHIPKQESDNWVRGLPAALAWEFVGYYVLFSSVEEYMERVRAAEPSWWRRILSRTNA
jgi:hypothetical protein